MSSYGRVRRLLRESGTILLPSKSKPYKPDKHCTRAFWTLDGLITKFGEGHPRFLMIGLTQTVANEEPRLIEAAEIKALSDVVLAHSEWSNDLMGALDGICLSKLLEEAKALRMGQPRENLRVLLAREIKAVLEP